MAEIVNCDKVTTVLLQQGHWHKVDAGTFAPISPANFLSGNPGTSAFTWKSRGTSFACPCGALVLVRYSA
jgi:hypothetical protein